MITTTQFIEDNKWTEEKISNLKSGDKLIFIVNGGMLSDKKGYVYTFEKWHESDYWNRLKFWKSKECMDTYPEHNFLLNDVELFDPNKHKDYVIVTQEIINKDYINFVNEWGEE